MWVFFFLEITNDTATRLHDDQKTGSRSSGHRKGNRRRGRRLLHRAELLQKSDQRDHAVLCRPQLAETAIYAYARGGTNIQGPSIRLAEAIAQQWGNMQFGIRELSNQGGKSEVQAFAWDVETNTRREVTFSVPHIRHTKKRQLQTRRSKRHLRACGQPRRTPPACMHLVRDPWRRDRGRSQSAHANA